MLPQQSDTAKTANQEEENKKEKMSEFLRSNYGSLTTEQQSGYDMLLAYAYCSEFTVRILSALVRSGLLPGMDHPDFNYQMERLTADLEQGIMNGTVYGVLYKYKPRP